MARYALTIGIQHYQHPALSPLTKAVHDAEDIACLLEQHGNFQRVQRLPEKWVAAEERYQVHPSQALSSQDLGRSLRDFLLTQAHKQDALIYFSGHGISVSDSLGVKQGYLAASDCQLEFDAEGTLTNQRYGISLDSLNALIQQSDLRSLVMLLDCCHSGHIIDRALTEQSLTAFSRKQDYCLITASRSFEQAYEGTEHSVFTEAVLQGLSRENANPETGRVSGDRLFDFVYTRLQNSGQEPFRTGIGRSITLVTYPIQAQDSASSPDVDDTVTPYRGLEAFEAEQAAFFFGRRRVVESIWNVLDRHQFVAVIGASGSGKSSAVRAGLIPWLQHAEWTILDPIKPGMTPLAELMAVLKPYFSGKRGLKRLDELVSTHPDGLRQIANHLNSTPSLLVIDQFEELFTVSRTTERDRFIHLLTDLAQHPHPQLSVVITLRADFLDPCLAYPDLTDLIQHQAIFMPPLVGADLERAIAQPALKLGCALESGLLGAILHDVGQETGSLPLLQFALLELWEKRDRTQRQLTRAAYAEMGGVMGALNDHAERVYAALEPLEHEWAKRICLKLVRTGGGDRDTRQRQSKQVLQALAQDEDNRDALEQALDAFVNGRLLVSGIDNDIAYIDLAHETLTEGWQRFAQWRDKDRDLRRLGDRIEDAYREWEKNDRSELYLLPKALTMQTKLYDDWVNSLSPMLSNYVQASYAHEQQQVEALERAKDEGALIARASEAVSVLEQMPLDGMVQAIRLVRQNLETAETPPIEPVQDALYQAMEKSRECNCIEGHNARIMDVACSADGTLIASSGEYRAIRLWDLQGNLVGKPLQLVSGPGFPAIVFHPHEPLVIAGGDREIRVLNYSTNQELQRIQAHWDIAFAIAISPDGTLIASGSRDHTIKFWTLDGKQAGPTIAANTRVWSLDFHPDGQMIVAGLEDHTIRLWNIEGEAMGEPFQGHQDKVNSVCFSPSGLQIISGSNDKTVRRWNVYGELLQQYAEHDDEVKSVAFNPDGTVIGSCSRDGTIRLRTLAGEPVMDPLRGHLSSVRAIAFHPTQPLLVSGSHDDTIRLWAITPKCLQRSGTWKDWLTVCCDRLRHHPVFKHPPDDAAREACEFCREWCGW